MKTHCISTSMFHSTLLLDAQNEQLARFLRLRWKIGRFYAYGGRANDTVSSTQASIVV